MREKAGSVPHEGTVVEIVGTGGDEANTFHIYWIHCGYHALLQEYLLQK